MSNTNDGPALPAHIEANYQARLDAGETPEQIAATVGDDPAVAAFLRSKESAAAPKGRKTARSETA